MRFEVIELWDQPFYVVYDFFNDDQNIKFNEEANQLSKLVPKKDFWQGDTLSSLDIIELKNYTAYIPLLKKVNSEVINYAKLFGSDHEYNLDSSWFNISKKNSYQEYHNHPNSIFSCVYYSNVPKNSGYIQFENPLNFMTKPKNVDIKIKYNWDFYRFHPKNCMLIIFRSCIKHLVSKNYSEETRISFSFNYS